MLVRVEEITINGCTIGHALGYADEREVADVLVNLCANRHRGETWDAKAEGIAAMLTSRERMDVGAMLETLVEAIEGAETRHRAAVVSEQPRVVRT